MSLSYIINALEKAPQGSRELDWRIAGFLKKIPTHRIIPVGWDYDWYRHSGTEYALWKAKDAEGRSTDLWQAPQVTTSVDAALTLRDQTLPGWRVENLCEWEHERLRERGAWMCDIVENGSRRSGKCSHSRTPALALSVAILKALHARGDA